jgi:hypothetical protein
MRFFSSTVLSAAAAGMLFASTVTAALHALSDREGTRPFYAQGNWRQEGPIGYFLRHGVDPSAVQLEEFYHMKTNQFFYTRDQKEISALNPARGVSFLGTRTPNRWAVGVDDFYVYPADGPSRVPLHRFSNGNDWLYTTDRNDPASAGYSYDGVSCWLPAGPVVPGAVYAAVPLYRWVRD